MPINEEMVVSYVSALRKVILKENGGETGRLRLNRLGLNINKEGDKMFRIVLGDITKETVDAIVNAANTSLLGGGGVDGAIHRAAGPELLAECRTIHGCKTGQAKITKGYRLPAKYVIHTPGPIWNGGTRDEERLLRNCYENCLRLAAENDCQSVAFPSISTGVYRFPLNRAAEIAIRTIEEYLSTHAEIEQVSMICFDGTTLSAYQNALSEWEANHV